MKKLTLKRVKKARKLKNRFLFITNQDENFSEDL